MISLGGVVVARSVRVGGNRFDESIQNYVRKKYNVMIGDRTAEEVKIQIGTALPLERELHMEVRGRDLIAGLPRTVPLTSSEVMEALEQPLQQIVGAVRGVLEETPPELSSRHHRQGHGHERRRLAAAQHRQAADPGHGRAVPRGRERAQLRRSRDRTRSRALRLLQEVARPAHLTFRLGDRRVQLISTTKPG